MRRNLQLFLYCGISTIIWGLIFGSFFGDIIPTVAKTFFGAPETFAMPALIDPIEDSILLLVLSLASVSYTHLDVYKRQIRNALPMLADLAGSYRTTSR